MLIHAQYTVYLLIQYSETRFLLNFNTFYY